MKTSFLAFLLAAAAGAQAQTQTTSGIIEYNVTSRIDVSEMRVVRIENGVRTSGTAASMPEGMDLPDVITTKQVITFTSAKAKVETEGGPMGSGGPMMFTSAVRATEAGGAPPVTRSFTAPQSLRSPLSNSTYIDLERKKYLTVVKENKDSVVTNVWFAEEDYKPSATLKASSKTKVIAGYACHRATAKMGDESFVIWYTTDLPFTFSPVNGILPEKGVILSIESSRRSYVAQKVELKPVTDTDVSLPSDAQKVSSEELKAKRRQIMERFHNEQLEKLQSMTPAE
jgi:GLPGLI family protein